MAGVTRWIDIQAIARFNVTFCQSCDNMCRKSCEQNELSEEWAVWRNKLWAEGHVSRLSYDENEICAEWPVSMSWTWAMSWRTCELNGPWPEWHRYAPNVLSMSWAWAKHELNMSWRWAMSKTILCPQNQNCKLYKLFGNKINITVSCVGAVVCLCLCCLYWDGTSCVVCAVFVLCGETNLS